MSEVRVLDHWDEVVGLLVDLDYDHNQLIFEGFVVQLNGVDLEKHHLEAYLGSRISILRTNIPETPLLVLNDHVHPTTEEIP